MSLLKEIFCRFNLATFEIRGNICFIVEDFGVCETRKLGFLACTDGRYLFRPRSGDARQHNKNLGYIMCIQYERLINRCVKHVDSRRCQRGSIDVAVVVDLFSHTSGTSGRHGERLFRGRQIVISVRLDGSTSERAVRKSKAFDNR